MAYDIITQQGDRPGQWMWIKIGLLGLLLCWSIQLHCKADSCMHVHTTFSKQSNFVLQKHTAVGLIRIRHARAYSKWNLDRDARDARVHVHTLFFWLSCHFLSGCHVYCCGWMQWWNGCIAVYTCMVRYSQGKIIQVVAQGQHVIVCYSQKYIIYGYVTGGVFWPYKPLPGRDL